MYLHFTLRNYFAVDNNLQLLHRRSFDENNFKLNYWLVLKIAGNALREKEREFPSGNIGIFFRHTKHFEWVGFVYALFIAHAAFLKFTEYFIPCYILRPRQLQTHEKGYNQFIFTFIVFSAFKRLQFAIGVFKHGVWFEVNPTITVALLRK